MRGLLILNAYSKLQANLNKAKRLKYEFNLLGVNIDILTTLDLKLSFTNNTISSNLPLKNYDFGIYLDKDEIIASMLEQFFPLFNSSKALINCNDKIKTYLTLVNHDIPLIKTIPSPLCYSKDYESSKTEEFFNYLESEFSYPFIVKCNYGSLGLQVYLVKNREELQKKYHELIHIPHFFQEYIESSKGTDYRLYTVNSKVVAYMKRTNTKDFRSNIALGGIGLYLKPNDEFIKVAEKVSSLLSLDYAGIDLLIDKNNHPILTEVNSNAFFNELEKISGENIAQMIAKYVINKVRK